MSRMHRMDLNTLQPILTAPPSTALTTTAPPTTAPPTTAPPTTAPPTIALSATTIIPSQAIHTIQSNSQLQISNLAPIQQIHIPNSSPVLASLPPLPVTQQTSLSNQVLHSSINIQAVPTTIVSSHYQIPSIDISPIYTSEARQISHGIPQFLTHIPTLQSTDYRFPPT